MKSKIITALFDINRDTKGDGRTIDQYLDWLKETLKLKCDITIFTEKKFEDFILKNRNNGYKLEIIIQSFEETPYYKYNNKIKEVLSSDFYKKNMRDINRIECFLSEYNVIQYSKFEWIKHSIESDNSYDFYFWVDAGISRFYNGFDLSKEWPDTNKLNVDKISIQGNYNYLNMFPTLDVEKYIWDNNCLLSGGIFGGGKEVMLKLNDEVNLVRDYMFEKNCFNNEQFALAIIAKKYPNMFNVIIHFDGTPMPIFRLIS